MILRQKEAKTLRFTITEGGIAVDVSAATLRFAVKAHKIDAEYAFIKEDSDFGKDQAALGIVTVKVSGNDLDLPATIYIGELEITFAADNIDRSADIEIELKRSVFHN